MDVVRPVEVLASINDVGTSIYCAKFNIDDSFLAYGKNNGKVVVVDTNLERVQEIEINGQVGMPVSALRWRKSEFTKNHLFVSSSDGTVSDWHAISGKQLYSFHLPEDDYGACCDFSPDGDNFVLGCKEGRIRVFDDSTKQQIIEYKKTEHKLGHNNLVLSLKWISSSTLISGSMDGSAIIWDIRTNSACKYFGGISFYGDSLDVNGDLLLTADSGNTQQVKTWSIGQGKLINSLTLAIKNRPFRGYTADLCKSGRSEYAFIGGNGSVQGYFIDPGTLTILGGISTISQPIYSCNFTNNSNKLSIASSNGSVHIIYLNTKGSAFLSS